MQPLISPLDLNNPSSGLAKHERLRQHLLEEMLSGRLGPGQALPSEHDLVETWGMARMTVRQAMAALEKEGLICRLQGKGTFVTEDVRQKLRHGLDLFALVVPETREGFYPSLLHGFETAARELHHQTVVCSTDDSLERQADIILQLLDKKVGGVAINPTYPRPTPVYQIRHLREHGVPVVFCHRRVEGIAAPLLALPYRDIGRKAGEAIVANGHCHVALFTMHASSAVASACEEGLREALDRGAKSARLDLVYLEERPLELRESSCWKALRKLAAEPDRPSCIFATFDSLAEMIYLMLSRLGMRVPEDVSLLGFGGAWREGAFLRQLSSVVVDEMETGRQAVSLLHEMRTGRRPIDDNTEITITLNLSSGATLAAAPQATT